MNNSWDDEGAVTIHGAWQAALDREAATQARRQAVLRAEALRTLQGDFERLRAAIVAAFKPLMDWFAQVWDTLAPQVRAWLQRFETWNERATVSAAKQRARIVTRAKALRRRKVRYASR